MKKKRLVLVIYFLLVFVSTNVFLNINVTLQMYESSLNVQPYSNITGYKYKTLNGIVWRRLWSYTYNRWEEPEWTPLS